ATSRTGGLSRGNRMCSSGVYVPVRDVREEARLLVAPPLTLFGPGIPPRLARCSKRAPYFQTVRPYHFPRDHTIDGSAAGASTLSLPAPCPLASAWLHRPSDRVSDGGELALFLGSFNTPLEGIRTLHPRDAWPRISAPTSFSSKSNG